MNALEVLMKYARQRPGLDFANYGDRQNYNDEMRGITADLTRAKKAAKECEIQGATDADIVEACKRAFSGRLTLTGGDGKWKIDYCTGMYWPTEYRAAVASVLETAALEAKRRNVKANPPPGIKAWPGSPIDMKRVIRLNKDNGRTWFNAAELRYFGTRIETPVATVNADGTLAYFVTSEQHDEDSPRKFSLRSVRLADGDINTIGSFHEHETKEDALDQMAEILSAEKTGAPA